MQDPTRFRKRRKSNLTIENVDTNSNDNDNVRVMIDLDSSEDTDLSIGPPTYFGCIKMSRSQFLTIVLLCEVLYFASTLTHIVFIYGTN